MKKNKVAIISNYGRALAPYIEFYVDLCKNNNVEYVVINKEEESLSEADQEAFILDKETIKIGAIRRTLKWYCFVLSQIKKHKCNKFVFLPTRTAIVLFPFLLFLKNKFIFDIRDYTKEYNKIYKKVEDILIKKSYMTTISSPGFREWILQSDKVYHIHNMPYAGTTEETAADLNKADISIGFLGSVTTGYQKYNEMMLQKLNGNPKYKFVYHGNVPPEFIEHCEKCSFQNVVFGGKYNNAEKAELYKNVAIINAVYGSDNLVVTTALPNKLYDAVLYKKPLIVSKGTYLASLVEKYKIGLPVDVENENIEEKLEKFLQCYSPEEHSKNCERMLLEIKREQGKTVDKIIEFFKK